MTTTFDTVAAILQKEFHVEPGRLLPDVPIGELALDSLALMEFVFSVEDKFGLRIAEDRLDPQATGLSLGHLCQVIDELRAEADPAGRKRAA